MAAHKPAKPAPRIRMRAIPLSKLSSNFVSFPVFESHIIADQAGQTPRSCRRGQGQMRSGDQESILCGHARQSGADPDFLSKSQVDSDFDVLRNMRLADLLVLGRQSTVREFTSGRRNAA